jgi:short-subunit dehydrogenase
MLRQGNQVFIEKGSSLLRNLRRFAFIQSFAEGLHFELKPFGVDVLCSAPGPVLSGFAGRANMNMTQAETPSVIAQKTVEALGSKLTIRPGFLAKFLGWSLMALTRYWRIRIMKIIMIKMASHCFLKAPTAMAIALGFNKN